MRKIEKEMCAAIVAGRNFEQSNTCVTVRTRSDGAVITSVYLFDNLIAQNGVFSGWGFKFCGWNTPTTRSRINAIMQTVCAGDARVNTVRGKILFSQFGETRPASITDWVYPRAAKDSSPFGRDKVQS